MDKNNYTRSLEDRSWSQDRTLQDPDQDQIPQSPDPDQNFTEKVS